MSKTHFMTIFLRFLSSFFFFKGDFKYASPGRLWETNKPVMLHLRPWVASALLALQPPHGSYDGKISAGCVFMHKPKKTTTLCSLTYFHRSLIYFFPLSNSVCVSTTQIHNKSYLRTHYHMDYTIYIYYISNWLLFL